MVGELMDFLIDFANFLISALGDLGNTIIKILPTSPLQWTSGMDSQILSWINWLIPIGEMIVIAESWLICIALWYVIRVGLNWIKVTGG